MAAEVPPSPASQFLLAKHRIKCALHNFKNSGTLLEKFPCLLFSGCKFDLLDIEDMKQLIISLLNLFSKLDSRHWSDKGGYSNEEKIVSLRGVCSRRGFSISNLVRVRVNAIVKRLLHFSSMESWFLKIHMLRSVQWILK